MGSSNSLPLPRYGCCIRPQNPDRCDENHAGRPSSNKTGGVGSFRGSHRRNLSATFNFTDAATDADYRPPSGVGLININTATEEELMTLRAVNRTTAHNIVEYRRRLCGGFRKVEDLALVSGVGAMRLNAIRSELTVGSSRRGVQNQGNSALMSKNSSTSSSGIDLTMALDDVSHGSVGGAIVVNSRASAQLQASKDIRVNVNTANVFQLMKVNLITQTLAENIVDYRSRRGRFSSVDDLVKVKGIKAGLVGAIRQNLVLDDEPQVAVAAGVCSNAENREEPRAVSLSADVRERLIPSSSSAYAMSDSRLDDTQLELVSLYGPLLSKSFRSSTARTSTIRRQDSSTRFRIATWNMDLCGRAKAENIGVREVVVMTILENELSIVAMQDLADDEALQVFCDELNAPTIPSVKKWAGSRGEWKCVTSIAATTSATQPSVRHHVGFMYDSNCCTVLPDTTLVRPDEKLCHSVSPSIAIFKVQTRQFLMMNPFSNQLNNTAISCQLSDFIKYMQEHIPDLDGSILVGQFHSFSNPPAETASSGLTAVLSPSQFTDISSHNQTGTACTQNIFIDSAMEKFYSGEAGVIREGLSSPWIPDGWSWGGVASSHCPVWIELTLPTGT